ncbi:MAG: phosphoribosyltransferase [Chitinophagales bacterium]|nr:phosphoribosyltransferase [Chitinophagales bacterium]
MVFKNRLQAAKMLAVKLDKYAGEKGVVLAVPRGGVPIAHYLARYLGFPLDLVMTKKIGHPYNPEFAIGAVSMEGAIVDEREDVSKEYILAETKRIQQEMHKRYRYYRDDEPALDIKDKVVIIVDDGIATGKTMLATIQLLRNRHPKKIIIAVPVAPPTTVKKIKAEADDFICLTTPFNFVGVGQFYRDFSPVEDEEVIQLLRSGNHNHKKDKLQPQTTDH